MSVHVAFDPADADTDEQCYFDALDYEPRLVPDDYRDPWADVVEVEY